MRNKPTKRALLASALAVMLCVTMLVGATFAWFTDSEASAENIIKSGNLDVKMYWADGKENPAATTAWTDASEDAIFDYANWEPGYVQVRHIKIENVGSLAFKYEVNIVPTGEVSDLADVIDVYYLDPAAQIANRTDLTENNKLGTLTEVLANLSTTGSGSLLADESDTITIALKMQESAGNEYQNLSIGTKFAVQLLATQYTYEGDSFDNQYDKDAEFAVEVKNADELATALRTGGLVKLANNISVTETLTVPAGVTVNLDLNGKTITGTEGRDADNNRIHVIVNNGILTIKDGTVTSAGENGGSAIYNAAGATLTIGDVTVNGAPMVAPAWPSYGINNYGNMTVNGATVKSYHGAIATGGDGVTVINDATVDVGQGTETNQTSWALYSFDNGQVTVKGGTFANTKDEKGEVYGGGYIDAVSSKPFIVNGGTFSKTEGDQNGTGFYYQNKNLIINGGTFDADPSAYVADSYQAVDNGDGTWTVKPYAVSTAADLANAIANGKTAVSLSNDIALNTQLEVKGELTILGNGNTITAPASGTRVVNVMDNTADVTVTLVDVKLDAADKERGISFYNNSGDLDVTIIDCEITARHYGVNVAGQNAKATLNIKDSTLTGYCAFQTYSPNTVATFDNCVLKGVNNWYNNTQYPYANNFATVVVNSLANNSTLTFNNCTVIATEQDSATAPAGQWPATQAHIIDKATGTTINWNNCTFIKNGVEVSAPESIN